MPAHVHSSAVMIVKMHFAVSRLQDDMIEVNLFGTKILLPKDAGAPLPSGGGAGLGNGRPPSGAGKGGGQAGAKTSAAKDAVGNFASSPSSPPAGGSTSKGGAADRSGTASTGTDNSRHRTLNPSEEVEIDDDDL